MSRRGISRIEAGIGLFVLSVLLLLVMPLVSDVHLITQRAELPMMIDAIKEAQIRHYRDAGTYISMKETPRSADQVDANLVPWDPETTPSFFVSPKEHVRGSYRVELTASGFLIVGVCDVDEDKHVATYTATELRHAERASDADVF